MFLVAYKQVRARAGGKKTKVMNKGQAGRASGELLSALKPGSFHRRLPRVYMSCISIADSCCFSVSMFLPIDRASIYTNLLPVMSEISCGRATVCLIFVN